LMSEKGSTPNRLLSSTKEKSATDEEPFDRSSDLQMDKRTRHPPCVGRLHLQHTQFPSDTTPGNHLA
jgi:hypothetical protein